MNGPLVGSIYYDLDLNHVRDQRSFTLRLSGNISNATAVAPIQACSWHSRLPDPEKFVHGGFGTSEIRGVVGGVKHPGLAAQSEAIERVLADGLTTVFSRILDAAPNVDLILLRGPAFPKTLGRFLSFHPPSRMTIAWVTEMSAAAIHPMPLLLPLNWYVKRSLAWDQEELLNDFIYTRGRDQPGGPEWAVEFIDLDGGENRVDLITQVLDREHPTTILNPKDRSTLPRELDVGKHYIQESGEEDFWLGDSALPAPAWVSNRKPSFVGDAQPSVLFRGLVAFPWR